MVSCKKKNWIIFMFMATLLMAGCANEVIEGLDKDKDRKVSFKLYADDFEGNTVASRGASVGKYDFLDYYITDESGIVLSNVKSKYNPEQSEIIAEGLHEGSYRLLVLGIKGEKSLDGAVVNKITSSSQEWLSFPDNQNRPLSCEYFYSNTPFRVEVMKNPDGKGEEVLNIESKVKQKRIMGKVVFDFQYSNPYIETAVKTHEVVFQQPYFYTSFSADSVFAGKSSGNPITLDLMKSKEFAFMPVCRGEELAGKISMTTRRYHDEDISQMYSFGSLGVEPNVLSRITVKVVHPDDNSGTMFMTSRAYKEGNFPKILQDDEKPEVYTDEKLRSFNTARPLQMTVTPSGQFNARFYSPRDLGHLTIQVRIPEINNEWLDFMYMDTIPGFGDMTVDVPFLKGETVCRTESGKMTVVPKMNLETLMKAEFRASSPEDFWSRLQGIKHGWDIYFSLYSKDPNHPTGGEPNNNWRAIRPVHCREAVAFFLNYAFMIEMPEHRVILETNKDKLYGNGGPSDKIDPDRVLAQMQSPRKLKVGLVYDKKVLGLGGGGTFGLGQGCWAYHYESAYYCQYAFHELGHCMGYTHNSAFTYGPWANGLMNNFYINNISRFPIDSHKYLDTRNNPNLYKW